MKTAPVTSISHRDPCDSAADPKRVSRGDPGVTAAGPRVEKPTSRRGLRWAALAVTLATMAATTATAGADVVAPQLVCSRGPSGQRFQIGVTIPGSAVAGSTYTIRLDSASSGKISQLGLNYIHDLVVDYALPPGASYVEGSAQVVAGTGTANVRSGVRLSHRAGVLTMALPGKVANGSAYTMPSLQFQLRAIGLPGSRAAVSFDRFGLTANAFLLGELPVSCGPARKPFALGTTLITTPAG